jgi:hypothetical protein
MGDPIFSIVTRHLSSRPRSFDVLLRCLDAQTYKGFEHVVLTDNEGSGVEWANSQVPSLIERATGDWVWVVDDDDLLVSPDTLHYLAQEIVENIRSPWTGGPLSSAFVKGSFATNGTLPPRDLWKCRPVKGQISGQNVVASIDLAMRCRSAWGPVYSSDYDYVLSCYKESKYIHYVDRVVIAQQRIGNGRGDDDPPGYEPIDISWA